MSEVEETKKVQDNESKAERMIRLGEYRVNKVQDTLEKLKD